MAMATIIVRRMSIKAQDRHSAGAAIACRPTSVALIDRVRGTASQVSE
jgi:hypothetical protein